MEEMGEGEEELAVEGESMEVTEEGKGWGKQG